MIYPAAKRHLMDGELVVARRSPEAVLNRLPSRIEQVSPKHAHRPRSSHILSFEESSLVIREVVPPEFGLQAQYLLVNFGMQSQ